MIKLVVSLFLTLASAHALAGNSQISMIRNILANKSNINCMNSSCDNMHFRTSEHLIFSPKKSYVGKLYQHGCLTLLKVLPSGELRFNVWPYDTNAYPEVESIISEKNIKSFQRVGDDLIVDLDWYQTDRGVHPPTKLTLNLKNQTLSGLTLVENYNGTGSGFKCEAPVDYR